MAEVWPAIEYHARLRSFRADAPGSPRLSTEMDDGSRVYRPSTTLRLARLSFQIRMSNADFATFRAWEDRTLVQGTLPFVMPVWTGTGYAERTCSFAERYTFDAATGRYAVVSLTLDVEDW